MPKGKPWRAHFIGVRGGAYLALYTIPLRFSSPLLTKHNKTKSGCPIPERVVASESLENKRRGKRHQ